MSNSSSTSLAVARDIHLQLAGTALTPAIAKLYSQYTRYTNDQPSLAHWRLGEAEDRLDDAVRLIDAALLKRDAGDQDWYHGMRRAAELLEWLSHPSFNLQAIPTHLLAAAAYQIAGYPAMAASLIERRVSEPPESLILRALLKGDFPSLFTALVRLWQSFDLRELLSPISRFESWNEETDSMGIEHWIIREVASALGVLCSHVRWGDEQRFEAALNKLEATSSLFLYGGSAYSWLLSKLVAETAKSLRHRLLRSNLEGIVDALSQEGRTALELYARDGYLSRRAVLWPSQMQGVRRLRDRESFVLCTPTGSGKTMVAEIGVLQSIFGEQFASSESDDVAASAPLALYLVPNRALAAEVESKLSRVLQRVSSSSHPITVTGLYGGTDWGPTDAWLTSDAMTVLICTYEKAEALIRFLGPLVLNRLRVVVIDEMHAIEFNGRYEELQNGENRALRLESLCTRLLTYIARRNTRVIGLSAVAAGIDNTLASWIKGTEGSEAISTHYRSTRQLIGRLECLANRNFIIRYDLLDGARLQFSEQGASESPFITAPFPAYPAVPAMENSGPEKRLRPYLYWAAMHLVQSSSERKATVLIFVPQQIGGYAEDLLNLLEVHWRKVSLPTFFEHPVDLEKVQLWERCLRACADYFTAQSREYRLLEKGIIVHHGKMPRLLSRLLVEAIEERVVNLVLATSTLSEGVNLPFEVLLVPTLRRGQSDITAREFGNLVGRTGRPGVTTEGRALVLLPRPPEDWSSRQAWERYRTIVNGLSSPGEHVEAVGKGWSPLAELLRHLREQWTHLPKASGSTFEQWLEETQPLEIADPGDDGPLRSAVDALDTFDAFLLPILVELKQLSQATRAPADLEAQLAAIWRRTYASYASTEEAALANMFMQRAHALVAKVYPDQNRLRQLYRTSLPPRDGDRLLKLYSAIRSHLEQGYAYAVWSKSTQFEFIRALVEILRSHPRFKASDTLGKGRHAPTWAAVLEWWLNPTECQRQPPAKDVAQWYDFVYSNFDYRFNWGFSSLLSLAFDEAYAGELKPVTLTDWPSTKLPWIAFWMKELLIWGILDPVAAFVMSRRLAWTRQEAHTLAQDYYANTNSVADSNILLDPSSIRDWVQALHISESQRMQETQQTRFSVNLLRDFSNITKSEFRVIPIELNGNLVWLDPAGFPLAKSNKSRAWDNNNLSYYDFILQSKQQVVGAHRYIEIIQK